MNEAEQARLAEIEGIPMTAPIRLRHADDCPARYNHDCNSDHPQADVYHPLEPCICGLFKVCNSTQYPTTHSPDLMKKVSK